MSHPIRPLYVFILAGGSGERFWPLSRQRTPKHLLRLLSERTLLEETIDRISSLVPPERIHVLTNASQVEDCRACIRGIPPQNCVAEPAKRDTAPAAALATAMAWVRDPRAICALLPADASIPDGNVLCRQLADAVEAASTREGIVTFSISPTYPSTGFGYLRLGKEEGKLSNGSTLLTVEKFVEKPDQVTAEEYIRLGNYGWNSGMFLWGADTFLREARRSAPSLADFIENFPKGETASYLAERFPALPKISVDYAILEKAEKVFAIRAEFDWDDVGTWTALPAHLGMDAYGNTLKGTTVMHESRNNIVFGERRVIALCGVKDLVVVETSDALLVCHKDAVQDIKKLQPHLPGEVK